MCTWTYRNNHWVIFLDEIWQVLVTYCLMSRDVIIDVSSYIDALRNSELLYCYFRRLYLRNEFHFSENYRSVNYIGSRVK